MGMKPIKIKHKIGASGARGPKLEVPKLIAGRGDLAILGGEGEGSLPLHHLVANELISVLSSAMAMSSQSRKFSHKIEFRRLRVYPRPRDETVKSSDTVRALPHSLLCWTDEP